MEPWDPSKIAQVIALVATGFAARWAYTTQFPAKDEEHTITVIWAAIWSGVIATICQIVHFPMPRWVVEKLPPNDLIRHSEHVMAYQASVLLGNLVIFTALGFVFGRLRVAFDAMFRESKMKTVEGAWPQVQLLFRTLFSRERGFSSACQYFLRQLADKQWVTVETDKGVYLGYVKVHDAREEDSFYLVLHDARMFSDVLGQFPPEAEFPAIMFKSNDIKSVALVKDQ